MMTKQKNIDPTEHIGFLGLTKQTHFNKNQTFFFSSSRPPVSKNAPIPHRSYRFPEAALPRHHAVLLWRIAHVLIPHRIHYDLRIQPVRTRVAHRCPTSVLLFWWERLKSVQWSRVFSSS